MIIICDWCGVEKEKPDREIRRQIKRGRDTFFCSRTCGAHFNKSAKKNRSIKKTCPVDSVLFITTTGKNERTFCSRSCASRGSITDLRRKKSKEMGYRNKKNLISIAQILKKREKWKYQKIIEYLEEKEIKFDTEYEIKPFVYDLILFDKKIIIEFDDPKNHQDNKKQLIIDKKKEKLAIENNWEIKRVLVKPNTVIDPAVIFEYV